MKKSGATKKFFSIISDIISASLIFLFVYVAISKIIEHDLFVHALGTSPLLKKISTEISWLIPLVEILISIFLLIPRWSKTGLLFSTLIMGLFTLYIGYMIVFIPQLPCSCGGILKELTWKQHLLFDIFLTLIAFIGFLLKKEIKILLQ